MFILVFISLFYFISFEQRAKNKNNKNYINMLKKEEINFINKLNQMDIELDQHINQKK